MMAVTTTKRVGWGVIGCSDIVERRAGQAIIGQEYSDLVAFHSRQRARGEAFARRFGAKHADDDLARFLARDAIDVVYVATEVDRHAELAIAAANAGKHVLVEKPMALNVDKCRRMIDAAARNGVKLAVAYYVRFFEKSLAMKRAIDGGALGDVVRANVRVMGHYNPDPADPKAWRVTARGGGNQLADIGSHRLDLLAYFLGRPRRVCGFADRLTMDYEAADTETALVQWENGAHVTVLANANVARLPASPNATTLEIYGTRGALLTDPWSDTPIEVLGTDLPPVQTRRPENAHFPMIDDFARAIAEQRPPRFTGVDGLWATAVIDGVYRSARTGRIVEIEQIA
ncbi:MAG: Gfo/Idh/MocA family oxidoreductase [Chloroflexi bacterium]|nr:Gfo/Idh/MocA family oxidoreductase [Chloroflexota bacterium]